MDYLSIKEDDKILIIAPHPDDECIGVGGLLLSYPHQCTVWVLTDGGIGQGSYNLNYTREIRHNEFVNEMDALGIIDYCFFDIPDGTLTNHIDCLNCRELSIFTKIFVTHEGDGHPDHTAARICLNNAVKHQNIAPLIYEYEVHSHIPSPTHMLDITELIEKKKSLIRFHESQLSVFPYDDFAEISAKYRAMQNRQKNGYLEVFRLLNNSQTGLSKHYYETELKLQKHIRFYQLLTRWMDKRNKGRTIVDFLEKEAVHSIAVYGYAELGKLTVDEILESKDILVKYVIDKKPFSENEPIKILKPAIGNPSVDAVIVTAICSFKEISDELKSFGYKEIYSLEEIIDKI